MFITLHNDCYDEGLVTQSCQTSCVVGRDMSVTLCNVDCNFLNKPNNSEEKKFACDEVHSFLLNFNEITSGPMCLSAVQLYCSCIYPLICLDRIEN